MIKKNIAVLIAAGVAAIGLLAGCVAAGPAPRGIEPSFVISPDAPAKAPAITFYGAWVVDSDDVALPVLESDPAAIGADGTVKLLYMFNNSEFAEPYPIIDTYLASDAAGEHKILWLDCDKTPVAGQLFGCVSPRFVAVTIDSDSGVYYAILITLAPDGSETVTSGVAYTTPSGKS